MVRRKQRRKGAANTANAGAEGHDAPIQTRRLTDPPVNESGVVVDKPRQNGRSLALGIIDSVLEEPGTQDQLREAIKSLIEKSPSFFITKVLVPLTPKELQLSGGQGDPITMILQEAPGREH